MLCMLYVKIVESMTTESWIQAAKRCSYTVFNTGIKFHTGELYLIWWIWIALVFIKGFEKIQDCWYFWKELYEPKYIMPYYNATSIVLKPILDPDRFPRVHDMIDMVFTATNVSMVKWDFLWDVYVTVTRFCLQCSCFSKGIINVLKNPTFPAGNWIFIWCNILQLWVF